MRSKELWLVEKNRATVKLDSSAGRSSLNKNFLQILKKMLEKSSQFLSSE